MSSSTETRPELPDEPRANRQATGAEKPSASGTSVLIKIIVFMMVVPALLILISKMLLN